jgi:DHA1 family multidrug resistance protein-like MFS transporter
MADIFRESALGYVARTLSRGKLFAFPEQKPDFQIPDAYSTSGVPGTRSKSAHGDAIVEDPKAEEEEIAVESEKKLDDGAELDTISTTSTSSEGSTTNMGPINKIDTQDPHLDLTKVHSTKDLERAFTAATMKKTATRPIIPTRTADGVTLVDWYTTDDPDNPQNWSSAKKGFVTAQIVLYTMAVYMGSSIYTASAPDIIKIFGVPQSVASLGLATYVVSQIRYIKVSPIANDACSLVTEWARSSSPRSAKYRSWAETLLIS